MLVLKKKNQPVVLFLLLMLFIRTGKTRVELAEVVMICSAQ